MTWLHPGEPDYPYDELATCRCGLPDHHEEPCMPAPDLRALSDAATPGSWRRANGVQLMIGPRESWREPNGGAPVNIVNLREPADAAYIVALVNWHRETLAASPSPDTDAGLDVERLARAIVGVQYGTDPTDADRRFARQVAAEYARLATRDKDQPDA